jgi:hypothetical protein
MAKFAPRLSVVPSNLPTQKAAPLSGEGTDCCGFRLLLPDNEVERTYKVKDEMMVWLRDGGMLLIRNESPEFDFYQSLSSNPEVKKVLGPDMLQSKLKLMQAAMSATPDQAKWWRFRSPQNEKVECLLTVKFLSLPSAAKYHANGPMYKVASGQFRGFEQGSPDIPPYAAHLDLFDETDRHFTLDLDGPKNHGQVLTQEEVNAIVASIRPTADH